jgi:exopolysaccharide production protein ExoQ
MASWSLWIVLAWVFILGTRPISAWFGVGIQVENPQDYLEGSPLDRNMFTLLIFLGLLVLVRRRVEWGKFIDSNRWFFAFFVYGAVSVIWSDYPFVSFKRLMKELGCVVMVLIILTESKPVQAFRAVLARFTYLAVLLSVVFIKYFPETGRYYNRWTWEYAYGGITQSKNELGIILFVCGLFLIWEVMQIRAAGGVRTDKQDLISRIALLSMMVWLMGKAQSSTSTVSLILGGGVLLLMRLPSARRQVEYLGIYCLLIFVLTLFLYSVPGVFDSVVGIFGRDTTLTGRTDMWNDLLKEPVNPIIGTGYQSFWLGPGAERMWERYYFHPTQAHNGYLETYLNGGLVGLCLLLALIISTGRHVKEEVLLGDPFGMLLLSFLATIVLYNLAEATLGGFNILWLIMLTAAMYDSRSEVGSIGV